ncbi:hypothetical protein AAFF_G00386850 [Aldrovandia affinis]|uniref:Uncharacterized protein n=1 Tax=Aldrovandia affinis TaxID=143900 RepID=A0AAD7R4F7_9TELE|nr:hypothetical protein AAFF_G00386850 [Aldrovandia affinis]
MASLRMLHIWDTRGLSSFRHLVVPSGRGKPPVGTETSGGGDPTLMRAILLSGVGQEKQAASLSAELFLWRAGLSVGSCSSSPSFAASAPSLAQEKGEFKFI